jgi:uncharacterized protein YkwD
VLSIVLRLVALTILVLPVSGYPDPVENRILRLANEERRKNRQRPLIWDEKLAEAARRHSLRMAARGVMSHDDPERGGLRERLSASGVSRPRLAENLHFSNGYNDAAEIAVEGWMSSEGHRRNLLDSGFSLTGIGVARARNGTWYATQIFAGP